MNNAKKYYFILALLLLFLAVWLLFYRRKQATQALKLNQTNKFEKALSQRELTDNQNRFIRAVAIHETGRYTSSLFTRFNNAFGMRPNKKRTKWYSGTTQSNYASYDDINDSIDDFLEWCDIYLQKIPDNPSDVDTMKQKGYFEDTLSNYKNAVTKYFNEA